MNGPIVHTDQISACTIISRKYPSTLINGDWTEEMAEEEVIETPPSGVAHLMQNVESGEDELGAAVTLRVSGAMHYKPFGAWDKIPYTVEVSTHIKMGGISVEDPVTTQRSLHTFALQTSLLHLRESMSAIAGDIPDNLYPELFED